jgi:hypothetical protein
MTVRMICELSCDICDTTFGASPMAVSSANSTRNEARDAGWRSKPTLSGRRDLCPSCAEALETGR